MLHGCITLKILSEEVHDFLEKFKSKRCALEVLEIEVGYGTQKGGETLLHICSRMFSFALMKYSMSTVR